jgi:hypothetical protein
MGRSLASFQRTMLKVVVARRMGERTGLPRRYDESISGEMLGDGSASTQV